MLGLKKSDRRRDATLASLGSANLDIGSETI
jgi:hypothetical protein